jgi:hypothetical protein
MEKINEIIDILNNKINEINVGELDFTYKSILEFVKMNINDDISDKSIKSESPLNPKDKIISETELNELDDGYETDDEPVSELIQVPPIKLGSDFFATQNETSVNDSVL